MRSEYIIMWLDDDFDNGTTTLNRMVTKLERIIRNKGFNPKILQFSNREDAIYYLNQNNKIDLFLSDYNIGDEEEFNGLDFLLETRKLYKQEMFLYSNQDEEQIKKHLLKFLSINDTPLELFGNFIFESASNRTNLINSIEKVIDLTLIRWAELNALRGLFLSETSQIHYDSIEYIKNNINDVNFIANFNANASKSVNYSKRKNSIVSALSNKDRDFIDELSFNEVQNIICTPNSSFYAKWDNIRDIRNGCAHVKEDRDTTGENFIVSTKYSIIIYEKDIENYRIELLNFVEEYYGLYTLVLV